MLLVIALLAAAQQRVAVLEFDAAKAGSDIDRTYFSDLVRGAVHKTAPQLLMMTRESTMELLKSSGKKLEDCVGECEVETGKLLGADYVVSGRLAKVGTRYALTLRLHATRNGELLNTAEARGKSIDELVDGVGTAAQELVQSLVAPPPPPPPAAAQDRTAPSPLPARAQNTPAPEDCSSPTDCLEKARALIPAVPPLPFVRGRGAERKKSQEQRSLAEEENKKLIATADWPRIKSLYTKACDGKLGVACVALGDLRRGNGDREGSLELYRRACDHAMEDWEKSCDAVEMVGFGLGYDSGEQSAPFFKVACDGGNAKACGVLAYFYFNGKGVPQDPALSRTLYKRACELGDTGVCNSSLVK